MVFHLLGQTHCGFVVVATLDEGLGFGGVAKDVAAC